MHAYIVSTILLIFCFLIYGPLFFFFFFSTFTFFFHPSFFSNTKRVIQLGEKRKMTKCVSGYKIDFFLNFLFFSEFSPPRKSFSMKRNNSFLCIFCSPNRFWRFLRDFFFHWEASSQIDFKRFWVSCDERISLYK